jgi:fatty acid desaturase
MVKMQEQVDTPVTYLVHHDLKSSALRSSAKEYIQLKQLMKQEGLLDAQPAYYACKILFTLGLLAIAVAILLLVNNFWIQLLNAVYLSFVFTQIGFLAHDIGHRQVFRSAWKNNTGGLLAANLLIGWSWSWWVEKHNRHHGQPNQLDLDPDLIRPFTAFTGEDARSKRGFVRFMVKYQAYFELPTYAFAPVAFLILSVQTLFLQKAKYVLAEVLLLTLHYLLYSGLLLWRLNAWQALLFVIINQAFFGLYVGSVVAPNHKGMLILDKDSPADFLHQQVLTSRNVKAHPLVDFWYGGLNYQIEHHLFPTMPRNRLNQAQSIVKAFCKEHSIAYHETSMLQSYREILRFLHQVSAPIREEKF